MLAWQSATKQHEVNVSNNATVNDQIILTFQITCIKDDGSLILLQDGAHRTGASDMSMEAA